MSRMFSFMSHDLPPWDRGALHAHKLGAGPTRLIRRCLRKAKSKRQGILARLSKSRRRYLDGLIRGLENELSRRGAELPE